MVLVILDSNVHLSLHPHHLLHCYRMLYYANFILRLIFASLIYLRHLLCQEVLDWPVRFYLILVYLVFHLSIHWISWRLCWNYRVLLDLSYCFRFGQRKLWKHFLCEPHWITLNTLSHLKPTTEYVFHAIETIYHSITHTRLLDESQLRSGHSLVWTRSSKGKIRE